MKLRIALSCLPNFVLGIGILVGISGCDGTSQCTLLHSDLSSTPPIGPVHLPTNRDGISFQGELSVLANQKRSLTIGRPNLNQGFFNSSDVDSSRINGPVNLTQDQIVVSGEGSIFFSRNFRLFLGLDGNASHAMWVGAGFSTGSDWIFGIDGSVGNLIERRNEMWTIDKHSDGQTKSHDTTIVSSDSIGFSKFNFTFSKRGGGPVIAYQALKMPITTAPNGDEYTKWLHTFTAGWAQPIGIGSLSAFVQTTNTGAAWSPSARVQYTFDLGGKEHSND